MHPSTEDIAAYRRKKRLWIIGGTIAVILTLGAGFISLGVGLVYNMMRPRQIAAANARETKLNNQFEITLLADGTCLWNGEQVSTGDEKSTMEQLKTKINAAQTENVWNPNVFIIHSEEAAAGDQVLNLIQVVQEAGGAWETQIMETP